jgi:hypothetical protein
MELIILVVFKARADVLTPPSLFPTSLPIRLLQSSQPENDHKRHCVESTFEKCKHLTHPREIVVYCSFYFFRVL